MPLSPFAPRPVACPHPSPSLASHSLNPIVRPLRALQLMSNSLQLMSNSYVRPLFCRPNEMFVVADSILQVVGYTPLALAAGGAGDMATALNSSRRTGLPLCLARLALTTLLSLSPRPLPPLPPSSPSPASSLLLVSSLTFEATDTITHDGEQTKSSPVKNPRAQGTVRCFRMLTLWRSS